MHTEHHLQWDDLRYFLAVSRARTVSAAAKMLGVNYTTVSRRIRALEQFFGVLLFEKSRAGGFVLTLEGQRLLPQIEEVETHVLSAHESARQETAELRGHIRLACTEAFGSVYLAPRLGEFVQQHPKLTLDLMPLPQFVSLSRREADLLIQLERPQQGDYVSAKLCDYEFGLYASPKLLARLGPATRVQDVRQWLRSGKCELVSYIEEMTPSPQLNYLDKLLGDLTVQQACRMKSTSIVAQGQAVKHGWALGILPCFMTHGEAHLVRVLPDKFRLDRSFWLCCRKDAWEQQRLKRLWHFLTETAQRESHILQPSETPSLGGRR